MGTVILFRAAKVTIELLTEAVSAIVDVAAYRMLTPVCGNYKMERI